MGVLSLCVVKNGVVGMCQALVAERRQYVFVQHVRVVLFASVSGRRTTTTPNETVERRTNQPHRDCENSGTLELVDVSQKCYIVSWTRSLKSCPLWEMRMQGRDGISRALYVTAVGRRVVVVRVFIKKTQKTPTREIELALKRASEVSQ